MTIENATLCDIYSCMMKTMLKPLPFDRNPFEEGWKFRIAVEDGIEQALEQSNVATEVDRKKVCAELHEPLAEQNFNEQNEKVCAEVKKQMEIVRFIHNYALQDHLFNALATIHKYCLDPSIKKEIEIETRKVIERYQAEDKIDETNPNFAVFADRAEQVYKSYAKLLDNLYGKDYTPATVISDEQVGALSIESNRITNEDIMQFLIAMSQNGVPTSGFKGEAQTDIDKIASGRLRDLKAVSGLQKSNNELKAKSAQGKTA